MQCTRCPRCEANLAPSHWILHQKTLHCVGQDGFVSCSDCLFGSHAFQHSLSHAFLEGHSLPALRSRILPAIQLPSVPKRIPLPLPQLPSESAFSERATSPFSYSPPNATESPCIGRLHMELPLRPEINSLQDVFRQESPSLCTDRLDIELALPPPAKSLENVPRQEPHSPLPPFSLVMVNVRKEEATVDDFITISEAPSQTTSNPDAPSSPEPTESFRHTEEDQNDIADCFVTEASNMMPEERPDSTDSPRMTPQESDTASLMPQTNEQPLVEPKRPVISDDVFASNNRLIELTMLNKTTHEASILDTSRNDDSVVDTDRTELQNEICESSVIRIEQSDSASLMPQSDAQQFVERNSRVISDNVFASKNGVGDRVIELRMLNKTTHEPSILDTCSSSDNHSAVVTDRTDGQDEICESMSNKAANNATVSIQKDRESESTQSNGTTDSEKISTVTSSITKATKSQKATKCSQCLELVVYRSPCILIRHALSCNNICLFNCSLCKGNWPTKMLAKRHLAYCRSKAISQPDMKRHERETLLGFQKCFPDMELPLKSKWRLGIRQTEGTPSKETPNKPCLKCERCFRVINKKDCRDALRHVISCMKIKPYRCSSCGHQFSDKLQYFAYEHITSLCPGAELQLSDEKSAEASVRSGFAACFPGFDHSSWTGFGAVGNYSKIRSTMQCTRCFAPLSRGGEIKHVICCLRIRPYICTACRQRSVDKITAFSHLERCVPGAEVEMDQEEAMNAGFSLCFPNHRHRHMQTGSDVEEIGYRKERTTDCARCFKSVQRRHVVQHVMHCLRIRPFSCTACDSAATRRNAQAHVARFLFGCGAKRRSLIQVSQEKFCSSVCAYVSVSGCSSHWKYHSYRGV